MLVADVGELNTFLQTAWGRRPCQCSRGRWTTEVVWMECLVMACQVVLDEVISQII